jgi:CRISPR-associated protein Csm1
LERAKEIDSSKNAITLFNETVKWESYLKVHHTLTDTFSLLKDMENTAFLYRLLELVEMKKRVLGGDIEATMWKSKLRYSWSRNMNKEDPKILESLDRSIENHPGETKMFLSEYIYKRRIA